MITEFQHVSSDLQNKKPLVYTALSKHLFYFRMFISKFVLEQNAVPLNPFMIFDYFMLDTIERDTVREANNNLVQRSDEVWVFGVVSDGMLAEIRLAKKAGKPLRFFSVQNSQTIVELQKSDVEFESNVEDYKDTI